MGLQVGENGAVVIAAFFLALATLLVIAMIYAIGKTPESK